MSSWQLNESNCTFLYPVQMHSNEEVANPYCVKTHLCARSVSRVWCGYKNDWCAEERVAPSFVRKWHHMCMVFHQCELLYVSSSFYIDFFWHTWPHDFSPILIHMWHLCSVSPLWLTGLKIWRILCGTHHMSMGFPQTAGMDAEICWQDWGSRESLVAH